MGISERWQSPTTLDADSSRPDGDSFNRKQAAFARSQKSHRRDFALLLGSGYCMSTKKSVKCGGRISSTGPDECAQIKKFGSLAIDQFGWSRPCSHTVKPR